MSNASSNSPTPTQPAAATGTQGGVADAPTVLSTLNTDGSRRWIMPKPSFGSFWSKRRIVAYLLIAVFTLLPWTKINGHPTVLLDLTTRHFYLFGATFLPTDTLLLAFLLVGVFIAIFLLTAVLGRVWCGWGCPQTVYMEFVYRPIERFFEGTPGRAKKGFLQTSGVGTILKYAIFLVISAHLANTFLAYFVGVENLMKWTMRSPLEHPTPFLVFAVVTGLMMFDFAFFREQMCLVACPYGRFQSVLLDRQSLIVSYDRKRGEPRGKRAKKSGDVSLNVLGARAGDCVDCGLCVQTCPTGIDIRNGLQMECVHCTQCIDACAAVMTKLGRPTGLIRYASQASIEGEAKKRFRPRLVVYPAILSIMVGGFMFTLLTRAPVEFRVQRARGVPYVVGDDGKVSNTVQIKLINRQDEPSAYRVSVAEPAGFSIELSENPVRLSPGQMRTITASVVADEDMFTGKGPIATKLKITGVQGDEAAGQNPAYAKEREYVVFGPNVKPKHHPKDDDRKPTGAGDEH